MPYNFDAKLIDRELALAEDLGFNCLRVVLPFVVWQHDLFHDDGEPYRVEEIKLFQRYLLAEQTEERQP
jgi:hypothetical protein